jgi:hypothetical protein
LYYNIHVKKVLLFLSIPIALLLVIQGEHIDPNPFIYLLFILIYFFRNKLKSFFETIPMSPTLLFFLFYVGVGLLIETSAWTTSYYFEKEPYPNLHPQLIPNLILGVFMYGAKALGWIIALRFFKFSLKEAFITQGLYAIFLEQQGAIFIQGLMSMPFGILLWIYVMMVYAPLVGIPYMFLEEKLQKNVQRNNWVKYIAVFVLLTVFIIAVSLIADNTIVKFLPPKRSIFEHPVW